LPAAAPGEAVRIVEESGSRGIHLLITDVVMPEMNGRDLSKKILHLCPGIKCIFMSGYTANVIAHHGVLDDGVEFLNKPFSKQDLASKIREVLDQGK
jgi:YesN/AraC family two-component response regulator